MKKGKTLKKAKMKDEINKLKAKNKELEAGYLRVLADLKNLQRRTNEDIQRERNKAKEEVILAILSFLDNLDKAEIFIKDKGLSLIKSDFYKTLQKLGIREIDIKGKGFNPHLCEAVQAVEGEKDGEVVEVVRKGYYLGDKVIRPARVIVSKRVKN